VQVTSFLEGPAGAWILVKVYWQTPSSFPISNGRPHRPRPVRLLSKFINPANQRKALEDGAAASAADCPHLLNEA